MTLYVFCPRPDAEPWHVIPVFRVLAESGDLELRLDCWMGSVRKLVPRLSIFCTDVWHHTRLLTESGCGDHSMTTFLATLRVLGKMRAPVALLMLGYCMATAGDRTYFFSVERALTNACVAYDADEWCTHVGPELRGHVLEGDKVAKSDLGVVSLYSFEPTAPADCPPSSGGAPAVNDAVD